MGEKYVYLWWDAILDIVQKDIGKVCKRYERNERLYKPKIFQVEKVMPTFEYEPLVFSLDSKTLDEEKDRGNTNGAGPSGIRTSKEKPRRFKKMEVQA